MKKPKLRAASVIGMPSIFETISRDTQNTKHAGWQELEDDLNAKEQTPSVCLPTMVGPAGHAHRTRSAKKAKRFSIHRKRKNNHHRSHRQLPMLSELNATSERELTSLYACHTLKAINKLAKGWERKFRKKVLAAIKHRIIPQDMREKIEALLVGIGATSVPVLTNRKARRIAHQSLHKQLCGLAKNDPDFEVAIVTFISGDGATSHARPVIELCHSQAQMKATLRAMAPDFFGINEMALFNSHAHPEGGQILQVHGHALIFGKNVHHNAQRVAVKHMSKFTENMTGAPQIDVRTVKTDKVNLARVCAYLFKAPYRCMTWCPPKHGKKGHKHGSEKGDRKLRYFRMAQIQSMLTIEDICFAGGPNGKRIKSDLFKLLKTTCQADCAGTDRIFHPDAIGAFTVEVAKALGKNDWTLPVIAKRK